jgi:phage shock protein E
VRRLPLLLAAVVLSLGLASCASSPAPGAIATVSGAEAVTAVTDPQATVIDVRTAEEVAEGALAGAVHIDYSGGEGFAERVDHLPRDGRYVLYCRTGNRSGQAAAIMADLGFTDLVNAGGYTDLVAAGAPPTQ